MDGEEEAEKDSISGAAKKVIEGFRDTRPDFLSNTDKKDNRDKNTNSGSSNGGAADGLRSAEKSAAGNDLGQDVGGLNSMRSRENKAGGFYSGGGKGSKYKSGKGDKGGKKKSKGWLKKGGPMGLIFGLILGVGGIIGGSQLFQPFSLVAQFQETFNSMQVSANTRSSKFFRLQMNGQVKDPVKGTIFGKKFSITKKQKEKLKQQGIEFDEDYEIDGKRTKVLKFDDGSGDIKIITAKEFDDVYSSDADFHRAYNAGSMTWRGQIANWFGTRLSAFLKNNNLTRNMFNDYESKKAKLDGDGLAAVKETLEEKTGSIDNEGEKTKNVGDELDEDATDEETGGGKIKNKSEDSPTDAGKLTRSETDLGKKMKNIESKFSASANILCGISNAVGAITMAVTAAEALQIINLATAYFEASDKVKAGDGEDSPIHDISMTLNEKKTTTNKVIESVSMSGSGSSESDYKAEIKDVTSKDKTSMEAEGVSALYSGTKVSSNDPSVQSFNLTSSINKIMGGISSSMTAFQTCTIAKMATSAVETVSAAIDVIECIAGIVTAETGAGAVLAAKGCGKLVVDIGIAVAKSVAISVAIAGVFSAIAPVLTQAWTRDLISDLGGEDLGNALTSGGNMYLGGAHRANGGSPATEEKYKSYAVAQHQVMEDYARYERESLDPFDTTSKYTFMGTLLTQLMNFTSASSLTSIISSSSSAISNSIVALSPTATAYDVAKTLPSMDENDSNYYGNTCPYLASVGVVGDAFCNPYVMTDMSTINSNPVDVIDTINNDYDGFTEETTSDGNVKISGDSQLAKYIVYCDGRTSMFGITDYNIVSSLNSGTSANTGNTYTDAVVDGAIGAIPIIGDGIDVVENINSMNNLGYISGESCVAGNNVSGSAPNWDEAQYYQRFIEDQSLAESMGVIEKSAVTAYLEEYYEENPLDNSYEGMLARYSGLDKETISDILYIARYYEFVNDYDPAERYAFGAPAMEVENKLIFDDESAVAENTWATLLNQVSYADVRNRSFAV